MAVYERTYKPYLDEITSERWRFLVLPRYAWREVMASRIFVGFLFLCYLVPLISAVLIYLPHNATVIKLAAEQLGASGNLGLIFDSAFFFRIQVTQGIFGFVVAFIIGPALISADLRNNALPLYFARPFSRWEYLPGKAAILIGLLAAITWVPMLLLFALQAYLTDGWFAENAGIAVASFLGSWLYIGVLTLLSLAIAAYSKWKSLARLLLFFVIVVGSGASVMLNLVMGTHWANVLNILGTLFATWRSLYGLSPVIQTPIWACWISLIGLCAFCLFLLQRKIRAYEVVR